MEFRAHPNLVRQHTAKCPRLLPLVRHVAHWMSETELSASAQTKMEREMTGVKQDKTSPKTKRGCFQRPASSDSELASGGLNNIMILLWPVLFTCIEHRIHQHARVTRAFLLSMFPCTCRDTSALRAFLLPRSINHHVDGPARRSRISASSVPDSGHPSLRCCPTDHLIS